MTDNADLIAFDEWKTIPFRFDTPEGRAHIADNFTPNWKRWKNSNPTLDHSTKLVGVSADTIDRILRLDTAIGRGHAFANYNSSYTYWLTKKQESDDAQALRPYNLTTATGRNAAHNDQPEPYGRWVFKQTCAVFPPDPEGLIVYSYNMAVPEGVALCKVQLPAKYAQWADSEKRARAKSLTETYLAEIKKLDEL